MKKLTLILMLGFAGSAQAGLISHSDYSSGGTITAAAQNSNENTIVNEFNGNIESANIKNGTIDTADLSSTVQASFVPTGTLFMWAGSSNSVPSGYLYCNGQTVNRTTYASLFSAIGTAYGNGNGSTTFTLPDMRGMFARGVTDDAATDPDSASRTASGSGGNTGNNVGSVQISTVSAHTHTATVTDPGHTHQLRTHTTTGANGLKPVGQTGTEQGGSPDSTYVLGNTTGITVANANAGGNETRPKNLYFFYIIKY